MSAPTSSPSTPLAGASFTGPAAAHEAIRETIGHYIEGLRAGDVERLRLGFHEQAIMCGYLGETPYVTPIEGLYEFVRSTPAPAQTGEAYRVDVTEIRVSGDTATVEVAEKLYLGHDFRTSFHLMKLDGRWWMVSKLFNALPPQATDPAGCPEPGRSSHAGG
ncbi:MAG: nuclear transport factor 2 family protein [Gemmatimonadaceae bacterium]